MKYVYPILIFFAFISCQSSRQIQELTTVLQTYTATVNASLVKRSEVHLSQLVNIEQVDSCHIRLREYYPSANNDSTPGSLKREMDYTKSTTSHRTDSSNVARTDSASSNIDAAAASSSDTNIKVDEEKHTGFLSPSILILLLFVFVIIIISGFILRKALRE